MKVGIKYCGGCNPRYDRSEWVGKLMAGCPEVSFEPAVKGNYYEVLLVINGCTSACADCSGLKWKERIIVRPGQEPEKVILLINELSSR